MTVFLFYFILFYFFFFFAHGTENITKLFSQDLKLETKIPGTFFRFYIAL